MLKYQNQSRMFFFAENSSIFCLSVLIEHWFSAVCAFLTVTFFSCKLLNFSGWLFKSECIYLPKRNWDSEAAQDLLIISNLQAFEDVQRPQMSLQLLSEVVSMFLSALYYLISPGRQHALTQIQNNFSVVAPSFF